VRTAPLKGLHYRSLKPHFFQELFPGNCDRGTELSEITLAWKGNNSKRAGNSRWTDDAVLNAGDFVKPHNCHYWADHDPSMTANAIETLSNCVVWNDCYKAYMSILNLLGNFTFRNVSQWNRYEELYFIQCAVTSCFAFPVRAWLDNHFPDRWTGHREQMQWPSPSLDFSLCDLFLWGWTKMTYYQSKPRTWQELKQIRDKLVAVSPDFITKSACVHVSNTLWKCVQNAEAYFKT